MELSNADVAKMLREVAAVLVLKKASLFQIRAYDNAADSIEHVTSEIQDLWQEGNLDQIPGIGDNLKAHLDELFKTGKVTHWDEIKKGIPEGFFEFLDIPGVGPKTAWELTKLEAKNIDDLKEKLESGELVKKGFSSKIAKKLLISLSEKMSVKSGRMLLPIACAQAQKVLDYLKLNPEVKKADVLGSLRRMVATVGDLDFAVATKDPPAVVEYITKMPGTTQVLDKGETKITLILSSGFHLDFLLTEPETYGALLQHFTGSKAHNIHLRTLAAKNNLSLSEYGVKNIKTGKVRSTPTEKEFYKLLKMSTPAPEIREDTGEIEAALSYNLPNLIEAKDIKGDLHLHDNFPIEPSHDMGINSLGEILKTAKGLNYQYIGISNHSPSTKNHNSKEMIEIIKKYTRYIEQYNYSSNDIRVLKLLEVDILSNGSLSVPDEGLKLLDFAIASVHSLQGMSFAEMTKRLLKAMENPYVKILGHPTNRLIERRSESDADWEAVFKSAAKKGIAMEINSAPDRLDLPDHLVRMAKELGVKFVIDTDSHEVPGMENMSFGVAVARRGWATKEDIINSWEWTKFAKWFKIKS